MNNKKAKVIMLGGCPRTGKTTLSVKLVKSGRGFSKISGDHVGNNFEFVKTLAEGVSERIYVHNIELKELCKKYNYRFINTGVGEERSIILNSLYAEIVEKCGGLNNDTKK